MLNSRKYNVGITGIGMFVPEKTYDNSHFESYLDTSDEWITQRTGVKVRHIAEPNTPTSELAYQASLKALEMSNTRPEDLDLILVATITPDCFFPSTACTLQGRIGAKNAGASDILAACSGFIYTLSFAYSQLALGLVKKILLVGGEVMSSIIDYQDRGICVLFGDGAGAVVLERIPPDQGGIQDFILKADGLKGDILFMPGGGSLNPPTAETVRQGMHTVKMEGREVFKLAVRHMTNLAREIVSRNQMTIEDIDLVVIHQANLRIVQGVMSSLNLDIDKMSYNNIDRYGNTTAASIPLVLHDAFVENRLNKGDKVLLLSLGAGLTYAAGLLEWNLDRAVLEDKVALGQESVRNMESMKMEA
jgi:3-oxoacyl-[acyl-carrier-protein] synthase-3